MRLYLILMAVLLSACVEKSSFPESTVSNNQQRVNLSRAQCSELGGVEVGDIGDGRIHRANYLCENGKPPLGSIVSINGQPIATEGSVCCTTNN